MSIDPRARRVLRWIDEAVIGLDLCPFASPVRRAPGALRLHLADNANDLETAVHATLTEARMLLDDPNQVVRTTLVVFPSALGEFEELLEAATQVERALADAGAAGILQVATFHPHYRFAGTSAEDLTNRTNRSPYPILHLLREEDVTAAIDAHPDPGGIPRANMARLRSMGADALLALWRRWEPDD